jgi:glycosyltransferase involved in cell wall biosynthesis
MHYGGVLAGRWLGIPVVLEDNGDALADLEAQGRAPGGVHRRVALAVMRKAVHNASHIIASGDGWRQAALARWGLPPERITTVENGTTLVDLLAREDLRAFAPETAGPQPLTLVYLGGFYPWHGVPTLLRAFARARTQTGPLRLLLIGAGHGLVEAQNLAFELAIAADVVFAGRLTDQEYAPLLAGAEIGVAPYCQWPEYSGLKVLDYKAAGLACIVSGRNGLPATLEHGRTGWITPPCDEDALVAAIVQLAQDPALRRRLGQAARLEAERLHSWAHTAARIEQFMEQARMAPPSARVQPAVRG